MNKWILSLTALFFAAYCSAQTPCSLDNTFANTGKLVADGSRMGEHIVVQPDGKILIACNPFGNGNSYIKRFNVDGSVDATYGNAGSRTISVAEIATNITGMAAYNGSLYLCGTTTTNIGGTSTYVFAACIDSNGAFVNSFGINGIVKFNSTPKLYLSRDICISNSGEIYIAGLKSFSELYVMKLHTNGSLNTAYDTDGILYVNTNNAQHWYDVVDMDLDKNNKVVICGKKSKANNAAPNFWNIMMMRFDANGSLDNSFANAGIGLYNSNAANFDESKKLLVSASGDYYVCGDTYDGTDYDYTVVKIKTDGVIDNSFANAGWALHDLDYTNEMENPLNAALLSDGRILITGNQGSGDTVYFALLMLKADGTRDVAFAPNGLFKNIFNVNNNSSSSGLALTPDGKIVLAGYTRTCVNGTCGPMYMAVSRYMGGASGAATSNLDIHWKEEIVLYPNPVVAHVNSLSLSVPDQITVHHVEFIDMLGNKLGSRFDKVSKSITLSTLAPGHYYCILHTNKGLTSKKILVE